MKSKKLRFGEGFRVALGNRHSQAAEMVLPPGDAEGDRDNRHRGADQWLYVVAGSGTATINGKAASHARRARCCSSSAATSTRSRTPAAGRCAR